MQFPVCPCDTAESCSPLSSKNAEAHNNDGRVFDALMNVPGCFINLQDIEWYAEFFLVCNYITAESRSLIIKNAEAPTHDGHVFDALIFV